MFRVLLLVVFLFGCMPTAGSNYAQELGSENDSPNGATAASLWKSHVALILEQNCHKCHNPKKKSGQLDLSKSESLLKGGKKGAAVVPGKPDDSLVYQLIQTAGKPHMPPGGKQLSEEQIAILKKWIERLGPPDAANGGDTKTDSRQADRKWLPPPGANPTTVIDMFVEARWTEGKTKVAAQANDRQFVRRLYLDLLGRIPGLEEQEEFLADVRSNKRELLVDQLLRSVEHSRYFAELLDTLLMGRGQGRQYEQRASSGWIKYLEQAIGQNRPWNQIVKEILLARPESPATRGATWFLFERKDKYQEIAEAVGPAVFGLRIECAQCHDHPLAAEIEQRHYWGMVAFFRRGKNAKTNNGPRIVESAIGGYEQFTDLSGDSHPNELVFFGRSEVNENRPQPGKKQKDAPELYVESKIPGEPRVPRFSRRQALVENIVNGHPLVAKSMVNRIWALLLGRGLVHPFDKLDSAHPASHPELLSWLSKDFERQGYNVRRLIRSLVLSKAYQLDSQKPAAGSDPASFSWSLEKPLVAEAWTRSISQLLRGSPQDYRQLIPAFRKYFPDVLPEVNITRLDQTMFLSNGEALNQFVKASDQKSHLPARLLALPDHRSRVEYLYRAALAREPGESELATSMKFLESRQDRLAEALNLTLWAIVTSAEFRINH